MSESFFSGGATSSSEYKKTFFNHVFSTTEEGRAEFLNIIQYSSLGILPVIVLNKIVNRMIPDADSDKSSLEIILEIIVQIIIMFCGIIFYIIHSPFTSSISNKSNHKYRNKKYININF